MHLFEQIVTAALFLVGVPFLVFVVVAMMVRAIRGTDLKDFEAMRTTNPDLFRRIVFVCRTNGAMGVGLGAFMTLIGLGMFVVGLSPLDLPMLLAGLLLSIVSVGMTWFMARWCRWAWRTEVD